MYLSIKPCCWKAITKKHGFSQSKILTLRRSFRRRSPPSGMLWMAMAKAMGTPKLGSSKVATKVARPTFAGDATRWATPQEMVGKWWVNDG